MLYLGPDVDKWNQWSLGHQLVGHPKGSKLRLDRGEDSPNIFMVGIYIFYNMVLIASIVAFCLSDKGAIIVWIIWLFSISTSL